MSAADGPDATEAILVEAVVEVRASSGHDLDPRGGPPYKMDGWTRLDGRGPGNAVVHDLDRDSMSEGSTLPPPYSSQLGETYGAHVFRESYH